MENGQDFSARGRVVEVTDDSVVFHPTGTNYQLHLKTESRYDGPVDEPVRCNIRVVARKVWTVPSGGLFIAPIFGPPKTIQGRVTRLDAREMVVHAGTSFRVALPAVDSGIELAEGAIAVGWMVNLTALLGATAEFLRAAMPA